MKRTGLVNPAYQFANLTESQISNMTFTDARRYIASFLYGKGYQVADTGEFKFKTEHNKHKTSYIIRDETVIHSPNGDYGNREAREGNALIEIRAACGYISKNHLNMSVLEVGGSVATIRTEAGNAKPIADVRGAENVALSAKRRESTV